MMLAECTLALSTKPCVSTSKWRFLPFTFLPLSYPRCSPPTPVLLTDWRIDDAGAWLGISPHTHAHPLAQGSVHPLPGTVDPPHSEVMVDGLPGREVVR